MAKPRTKARTCSRVDHDARWRPGGRTGSICGYTFRGKTCGKKWSHHCEPRADRVVAFFAELLVFTKGPHSRKPFLLEDWQEHEIIRPLFGEVIWSHDWERYVRRYVVAGIIVSRKSGKSELAAGITLYLLIGDDEEAAEVYGAAKTTKQAGKVWAPAKRMKELSPVLNKRLEVNKFSRRIFDERTASFYEVIAADAEAELGHNPHGFVLDEVLSQPDDSLWNSLRTAAGARVQPLFVVLSTETDRPMSFGADMIDEFERIQNDPARNPRWFAFVRKTPMDADPWDEANWYHANPALGRFLSIESLQQEALEAKNDSTKENSFRQFRLNQRVQQKTRWMQLHLYDASAGMVDEDALAGRRCFGGLDLASVSDLTSLCWLFPSDDRLDVIWRHFVPEDIVPTLDKHTAGKFSLWAKEGFITITEGNVVDYDELHAQMSRDGRKFAIQALGIDRFNSVGTTNWMEKNMPRVKVHEVGQGFVGMSTPMKEIMRRVKLSQFVHGANPVARWCFDSVEVIQDAAENIKPVKPDRQSAGTRIDAVVSAANAIDSALRFSEVTRKASAVFL